MSPCNKKTEIDFQQKHSVPRIEWFCWLCTLAAGQRIILGTLQKNLKNRDSATHEKKPLQKNVHGGFRNVKNPIAREFSRFAFSPRAFRRAPHETARLVFGSKKIFLFVAALSCVALKIANFRSLMIFEDALSLV